MTKSGRSGCKGFADEEIYSMAVHYYDEDDIEEDKERLKERQMKKFNRELRWL